MSQFLYVFGSPAFITDHHSHFNFALSLPQEETPITPTPSLSYPILNLELEVRSYTSSNLDIQIDPDTLWLPFPRPQQYYVFLSELDLPDPAYVGLDFRLDWSPFNYRIRNIHTIPQSNSEIAIVRVMATANIGIACNYILFDYPLELVRLPPTPDDTLPPYKQAPPYAHENECPEYSVIPEESNEEMSSNGRV